MASMDLLLDILLWAMAASVLAALAGYEPRRAELTFTRRLRLDAVAARRYEPRAMLTICKTNGLRRRRLTKAAKAFDRV